MEGSMKKLGFKKFFIKSIIIVAIVFNVVVFLATQKHSPSFWLLYGFFMLGFVWFLLSSLIAKEGKTGIAFIHPTVTISGLFWMLAFLFALVFMWFPNIPYRAILIPMVIITGIFAIVYVFALMNKALVAREEAKKPYMQNIKDVHQVLESLSTKATDAAVKRALDELVILAEGMDISVNPDVVKLDERIAEYVQFVHKNLERNEMKNLFYNIDRVKNLLTEREKKV
jgi:hypothetical protein